MRKFAPSPLHPQLLLLPLPSASAAATSVPRPCCLRCCLPPYQFQSLFGPAPAASEAVASAVPVTTGSCCQQVQPPCPLRHLVVRRLRMLMVQAASKAPPPPLFSAGLPSRPAPTRPNKRAASSFDPSRAKRSRPATRTSQAGMSSSNNSSAEAGRQPRRDQ
ncbi:hypothetical protein V6N12_033745 [Hibiscus sabdariffa]|uniref:Secreted protein n=1 Tax=Hibiscus sabdariffa TaxID=183260 RepID=A0ABR2ALE4_9ROSI